MGATSVTGIGGGASNRPTLIELSTLANGPQLMATGYTTDVSAIASPPSSSSTVTFPAPFPGGSENYVVMLTSIGGGAAYIASMNEDDNGNFEGFMVAVEDDSDVMYAVFSKGVRPTV